MVTSRVIVALAVGSFVAFPAVVPAGVPDLQNSTAECAAPAGAEPVLCNRPDGGGAAFDLARHDGAVVDATITLHVRDQSGAPVAHLSAYDLWLEPQAGTGEFLACAGGTAADQNTDVTGTTRWRSPLQAGGWSSGRTLVFINGSALISNDGLPLRHNSPDLNADGVVDLADIQLFVSDYFGSYQFRSDLNPDGQVDLADLPLFARAVGAACP